MDEIPGKPAPRAVLVPIRSLGPSHRERILAHLLALSARDRYLRFGYSATDEQVGRYVQGLDLDRDDIFGIYNRKLILLAVAHLAITPAGAGLRTAEFGVSVLPQARGRGYGARLFDRAAMHARNLGVETMTIHALSENTAMLKIANRAGAVMERAGAETGARLRLPAATWDSQLGEAAEEQFALTDYRFKLLAHHPA